MADYLGMSATELAQIVRTGQASARDVVDAHLAHISRVDAKISAFRVVRAEQARVEAEAVDGVPTGTRCRSLAFRSQ